MYDVDARVTKTKSRCGVLGKIFDDKKLNPDLKIRLYVVTVCSLLTYGSETWDLDDKIRRKLNNANSIMLARVTGRTFREEARPSTTSFDLVLSIRRRRLRWLGHILRAGDERIVFDAIKVQTLMDHQGNLWMDSPHHDTLSAIKLMVEDRQQWRKMCNELQ